MATRRMTSSEITNSDAFINLPLSAQALYFHLNQRADDDGFINNPIGIIRLIGASTEDLKQLIDAKYLIDFDGVVVIKHWLINNQIRADRKHETRYKELLERLEVKSNGAYTLTNKGLQPNDNQVTTKCPPSLVKSSLDKSSIGESSLVPTRDEILTYVFANDLNVDVDRFIDYYEATDWMSNGEKIRNWKALIRKWSVNEERPKQDNALSLIDQIVKGVKV